MATFKSFEEIEAWKKARILSDRIYKLTIEGTFAKDFKLREQINGSSGSVMDNIAEGYERDGTREFIQFLSIAKGSVGETRSQLYRALDRNHIDKKTFDELTNEATQIGKQLSSLMRYLNRSGFKGTKFANEHQEPYPSNNM